MLEGSFLTSIARRALDCTERCVWTEPLGEMHSNVSGTRGARVVVVQPNARHFDEMAGVGRLTSEVSLRSDAVIAADGRRIVDEMRLSDSASPLAIEALIIQIMARGVRAIRQQSAARDDPRWVARIRELLHARFRDRLTLGDLAAAAEIHPCHLSRSFRRHFHKTFADYVRALRADWAAEQLATSDASIAEIAVSAGYVDQSHFTRQFRMRLGVTPAEYRRCVRGRPRLSQIESQEHEPW
jgi:AraC family transcriptional regulator